VFKYYLNIVAAMKEITHIENRNGNELDTE